MQTRHEIRVVLTSPVFLLRLNRIVGLNGQAERLIDGNRLEVRREMSVGCHGAEQLFGDVRHVDRSVDFRDVFAELRSLEPDEMVHVNVSDEEHRARVIVAFERVDGDERILFQDAMVGAHRAALGERK